MAAAELWIRLRAIIDRYFRSRALRDLGIMITPDGGLYRDFGDVLWSEEAHATRCAAYFVIDPKHLPYATPDDVAVMRKSLEHGSKNTHHAHIEEQPNGRLVAVLAPGAAEALGWAEGDRIAFKKLYSGELLTRLDKRPRVR